MGRSNGNRTKKYILKDIPVYIKNKQQRIIRGFEDLTFIFFFSSRRRHTRFDCDWSSDVCSSDLCGFFLWQDDAKIREESAVLGNSRSEPRQAPQTPRKPISNPHAPLTPQSRGHPDRKSTRLNSSHSQISYAVFCLQKKKHYSHHH